MQVAALATGAWLTGAVVIGWLIGVGLASAQPDQKPSSPSSIVLT